MDHPFNPDAIKADDQGGDDDLALRESAQFDLHQLELEHKAQQLRTELGWLGKFFGGRQEKAGNISAIVLLLCFLALAAVWLSDVGFQYYCTTRKLDPPALPLDHAVAGIASIITLILGYLFGSNQGS